MKALIAVKGSEDERFYRRAAALLPLARAEVVILAYVIDSEPRGEMQYGRDRYFTHRSLPANRSAELERAEEERARAGLEFAVQVLREEGLAADQMRMDVLRGKPGEALRDLAEREGADVVVVGGRAGKPGPHSLGKTARFLVDHAPNAALLIRP